MTAHDKIIDTLLRNDRSAAPQPVSRHELAAALDLAERYARIEKTVLGAAKVAYSPVSLEAASHMEDDPLTMGEFVATSERARLGLPIGPILELWRLIEEQGIKVLPRPMPPQYSGGFFFDAQLGPCVLVQIDSNDSTLQYALAHQYAHFILDYDPYITTLCGWPSEQLAEDPIEQRAHHTALALLMPRAELEMYRDALGPSNDNLLQPELVHQLRVYFELDPEQVLWRLLMLGWIDASALESLLQQDTSLAATLQSPSTGRAEAALLPERFVRLVASAFGSDKFDLETAAHFLGTDFRGAERILGQFDYEVPASGATDEGGPGNGNGGGSAQVQS